MTNKPNIPDYLLWEYDLNTFNYENSYKIVIERVLLRGTFDDWREMLRFYSLDKIMGTIEWTKQLGKREKDFAKLILKSDILKTYVA